MRKNEQLKVIGLGIMIVDHVALFCFGGVPWLYVLARFVGFPFFAYGVATGARFTSRPVAYLKRLLIFAVLCQPIFYLATDQARLNIVFTLFLGALCVMLWHQGDSLYKALAIVLPLLGGSFADPHVGYGAYGVYMILAFGISPTVSLFYHLAAAVFFLGVPDVQCLAALSLVFIYLVPVPSFTLPKWVYYFTYPGHLVGIALFNFFLPQPVL